MKNRIGSLFLALVIAGVGIMLNTSVVNAQTQTTGWTVTYDGKKFSSDYDVSKSTITSAMPGDTISFEVNYKNASGTTSDFYVSTDVINSLEEKSIGGGQSNAAGGAYTYKLSYKVGNQETVIHDSETVGGDNNTVVGLKQAVGNLESGKVPYFNVGRLTNGQTGTIIITVKLDGNSQDNNYMKKLATLDLKFGAEKVVKPQNNVVTNTTVNHVVYTTPGGVQVVAIDEPKVPQAGGNPNPVTGDSLLPIILCTIAMFLGIMLVVIYFKLEKDKKEELNMNKIKKIGSSLLMILLMLLMTMTISTKAEAGYTYKISFIIGGSGDEGASFKSDYGSYLNVSNPEAEISVSGDCVTVKNLNYNDAIVFNPKDAVKIEKADSEVAKYYVKGCRRSGDNTSSTQSAFTVTKDDSYVIAYGVGTVVPYQVKYSDEGGNPLAEAVTYYGGLGEEVYVPYKYIDGYTPKVNNYHIESLKENQIIEFTYTKAKTPSGSTTYVNDSRTEYSTVKGQDSIIYQPTENPNPADEGGVVNNRDNTPTTNNQNAVDQNDEVAENVEEIQDEDVPAAREDVVDIPDEDPAKGILDDDAEHEFLRRYSLLIAILGVVLILIFVIAAVRTEKEKREKN